MKLNFEHKIVNSFNADEIAISRIHNFIKSFVKDNLMMECHKLCIDKEGPFIDKSNDNKNNWDNQSYLKSNAVKMYSFSFYIDKPVPVDKSSSKSAFLMKYEKYTDSVLGNVYYAHGNILKITMQRYADKTMMLDFVKFHPASYEMLDRYYRLSLLSLKNIDLKKVELRGLIECSFRFKNKKCLIEYIATDIRVTEVEHNVSIFKGSSTVISDLLRAVVGPRSNIYKDFMITFHNNEVKQLHSVKLEQLQMSFPDFPVLYDLISSDYFEDYILILEIDKI